MEEQSVSHSFEHTNTHSFFPEEKPRIANESPPASNDVSTMPTSDDDEWEQSSYNPFRWSQARKYALVILISLSTITTSVCSTAFEPGLPTMMEDFHSSSDSLSSLFVTVYLLGYVLGPLIVAPLSELYGRTVVLWPAYILFLVTVLVCAISTSLTEFIVIRCFMGFAANAFVIVGPAVIADMIRAEERGLALSVLSSGPILGPTLGPLIGGVIVEKLGWRWVFWLVLIILSALAIASLFILRETYAPILLRQRESARAGQQKRRIYMVSSSATKSSQQTFRLAFVRPVKLFVRTLTVPLLGLYTSVSYAYLNVLFATLGTVYQDAYGFDASISGAAYLGMTVGFIVALATVGAYSDRHLAAMYVRHGVQKPEFRLPPAILGAAILPPAILWYGWALQYRAHWIVPLIASAFVAVGSVYSFLAAQMYLVDTYNTYAASATGAVSIFRAVCSAVIPLAANPAYDRFGYGWGNTIFALVAVPFLPLAIALLIWGERLRLHRRFQPEL